VFGLFSALDAMFPLPEKGILNLENVLVLEMSPLEELSFLE
jgi:hypothetical protein